MLDLLLYALAIALASFALVHVTPDDWVEPQMTAGKRLWGALLTPGLAVVTLLQHFSATDPKDGVAFREDIKEYLGAVWLGREFS